MSFNAVLIYPYRLHVLAIEIMVPEYNSYRSACVLHTSNHSFISANLVALSINFASMGGNSELSTGISSYNLKLSSTCSKGKSESSLNFAATMSSLLTSNSTLQVLFIMKP
jgi:hypothetical protein